MGWELLIDVWKFPPDRLYATVYKPGPEDPAEFDQEANNLWSAIFDSADSTQKFISSTGAKKIISG